MGKGFIKSNEVIYKDENGIERKRTVSKEFTHKMDQDKFYMTFIDYVKWIYGLTTITTLKVLYKLLEIAEYNTGEVSLSPGKRQEIMESIGIKKSAFTQALNQLVESGALEVKYKLDNTGNIIIGKNGEPEIVRGESRVYAARPDATAAEKALANEIGLNAREDALRMYLGFPQKYDTYIPNGDGTFSYNIEKLKDTGFKFEGFGQNYDYLTTNAGNWKSNGVRDIATNGSSTYSIHSVEDVWDLNPFQSSKLPFLRKIEAGKVIGGKPFILKMDIPLTSFSDKPPVLGHIK